MARFQFFNFRRRSPAIIRWSLRIALLVAAGSAIVLLVLLAWSTGNASRFAQQYDLLLLLTGVLAVALLSWVLILSFRLVRQIRRRQFGARMTSRLDRKSTRLNSSHVAISYAVFCLKQKNKKKRRSLKSR